MKKIILFIPLIFIFACQSEPVKNRKAAPEIKIPAKTTNENQFEENIDYEGLLSFLKLNRRFDRLGYTEKTFNTCEVGYGYSATHNCRRKTFVVIQFQLMCRDSEGTVSEIVTEDHLQPIARQNLKWTLKNLAGKLITDSEGFGRIAIVSNQSQRYQRLKLTLRNDFLFLKAGEITRMITPKSWCE